MRKLILILLLMACASTKPDVEILLNHDKNSEFSIIVDGSYQGILDNKYNKIKLSEKDSIVIVIKKVK